MPSADKPDRLTLLDSAERGDQNNIEETFSFYRMPKEHHRHLKSTNVLERLNQELKRRTHVIRILPKEAAAKPNGDDAG
jgi:transposase-like protein